MALPKTRLEFFEHGYGQIALDLGIISPSLFMQFIRYKAYMLQIEAGYSKMEAISIAAETTKSCDRTIRRAIEFFGVRAWETC